MQVDAMLSGSTLMSPAGPVPEKLREHENFEDFQLGIALDGPSLPRIRDTYHAFKMIVIVPVVLGYADLASDMYTALSYYRSDHPIWFGLGLMFALGPALITSVFFLSEVEWHCLLYEAYRTVEDHFDEGYSPALKRLQDSKKNSQEVSPLDPTTRVRDKLGVGYSCFGRLCWSYVVFPGCERDKLFASAAAGRDHLRRKRWGPPCSLRSCVCVNEGPTPRRACRPGSFLKEKERSPF